MSRSEEPLSWAAVGTTVPGISLGGYKPAAPRVGGEVQEGSIRESCRLGNTWEERIVTHDSEGWEPRGGLNGNSQTKDGRRVPTLDSCAGPPLEAQPALADRGHPPYTPSQSHRLKPAKMERSKFN